MLMKREDTYFTSVGNNFCRSAHFLPSDFKLSTLIETGSRTLSFAWTIHVVDDESLRGI